MLTTSSSCATTRTACRSVGCRRHASGRPRQTEVLGVMPPMSAWTHAPLSVIDFCMSGTAVVGCRGSVDSRAASSGGNHTTSSQGI